MANDKDFIVNNAVEVGGSVKVGTGTVTSGTGDGHDLTSASYDGVIQFLGSGNTTPSTFRFNNDGTKLFCQDNNDRVYEYALSTAYDITSASLTTNFYLGSQTTSATSLAFNNDGTKMYIGEFTNDTILQYSLSTGFDVSTASYDSVTLDVSSQSGNPSVLLFNSDGTKLWVSDGATPAIYQYNLTTGFDLSTGSYASKTLNLNVSPVLAVNGFDFNADGTQLLVIGSSSTLYKYDLSTAYDISTATRDTSVSFSVSTEDASPTDFLFYSSGQKMLILGASNDTIYQYSTAPNTQTLDLSTGNYFNHTLTEDTKFLLSNAGDVQSFQLEVTGTPATSGDILFFAADAGNSSNYGAATGWTNIVDIANQGGIGVDSNFYLARQTVASDGTYSISFSTANANAAPSGGAFLYNGGTYQGISRGASTVSFASGLTVGESVLFLIESNEDSTETYTPPTGYTLLFENISSETTATATVASYKIADATSESTDGGTWSGTSDVYRALVHVRNSGVTASASDIFSDAQPFTSLTTNYSADGDVTPGTITWSDTIEWPDGTAPLSPSGGEKDLYTFTTDDSGTTYKGVLSAYNLS